MKLSKLDHYLSNNISEFYGFSYCLVPDDLQAKQIVLDAMTVICGNLGPELDDLKISSKLDLHEDEIFKAIRLKVLGVIFKIARKRLPQLVDSLAREKDLDKHSPFFRLELGSRAVLFLKERLQENLKDIEKILDYSRSDIISELNLAREKILQQSGQSLKDIFESIR